MHGWGCGGKGHDMIHPNSFRWGSPVSLSPCGSQDFNLGNDLWFGPTCICSLIFSWVCWDPKSWSHFCLHNTIWCQIVASLLSRYIQNLDPSCDLWCCHLYPDHCHLTWTTAVGSWLVSWLILLPSIGPLIIFSLFGILESHSHFINGKMKVVSMNCMIWLFSDSLTLSPLLSPSLLCFSTLASLSLSEPLDKQLLQDFCISLCGEHSSHR